MTTLLALALLSANPTPHWVIPPGQESLILQMTHFQAAGCELEEAKVESDELRVAYKCGAETARVGLRHKDKQGGGDVRTRTEQFAIVLGTPPPPEEVLTQLEERVRANEANFKWVSAEPPPPPGTTFTPPGGTPQPMELPPPPQSTGPQRGGGRSDALGNLVLVVGALAVVGIAVYLVRRRKRASGS